MIGVFLRGGGMRMYKLTYRQSIIIVYMRVIDIRGVSRYLIPGVYPNH